MFRKIKGIGRVRACMRAQGLLFTEISQLPRIEPTIVAHKNLVD